MATTKLKKKKRFVGQRMKRKEDPRLITGRAHYVDDLPFADVLYVEVVRSEYVHAKIKKIDTARARAAPGVVGVYTHGDLKDLCGVIPVVNPGMEDLKVPEHYPLAGDEVCFVGQPLAAVVAEDRYGARDAAALVEVDYEPLPVVVDPEKAVEPDSPTTHTSLPDNISFKWKAGGGDVEAAFKSAEKVIRQKIISQRLVPCAMETRGVVARYFPGEEELSVWTSTQVPHIVRSQISTMMRIPENKVRVVAPEVGGGFGSKLNVYAEEGLLASLAFLLAPRPVKWIETRRENIAATIHGRDQVGEVQVAARKDGKVLGIRCDVLADIGAYHQLFTPIIPTLTGSMLSGCYSIPAISVSLTGVFTNKMSTDAYRGAGRPEATFVIERVMDMVAAELDLDPLDVRRANFITEFPFTTVTGLIYDSGDYRKAVERAVELSKYEKLRRDQETRRKNGELIGIGVSTYVEICAMGPSKGMAGAGWESAKISVAPDGSVDLVSGACPHGQGQETSFAQIVADELGISPDSIRVTRGDTARLQFGTGTFGSRATAVGGTAALGVARKVLEKMKKIAAHLLEVPEPTVEVGEGAFRSGDKTVPFADVAFQAHRAAQIPQGLAPGLEETYIWEPENFTFPFGTHICQVRLDPETGEVTIESYFAVDDCGRVINPLLVDGQVHGGIAQGLGQALYEEAVYDEDGQLLSGTFMDYTVPKATQLPWFHCDRTETPTDVNPLGVKGVGEAGTIGSTPVLVNAVVDALRPYGVKHIDMPLRPEKIWRAIQEGRRA